MHDTQPAVDDSLYDFYPEREAESGRQGTAPEEPAYEFYPGPETALEQSAPEEPPYLFYPGNEPNAEHPAQNPTVGVTPQSNTQSVASSVADAPPPENGPDRGEAENLNRFQRLQKAEREQPAPAKKRFFAENPKSIPVPAVDATFEELNAYRLRANRAGAPVTAKDLETYVDLIGDGSGRSVLIEMPSNKRATPGLLAMSKAYAAQHPEHVKEAAIKAKWAAMNVEDNRDYVKPERLADIEPERVTEPNRFAKAMKRMNALPPLPEQPSPEQFGTYRSAFRDAGLRLQTYDLYVYQQLAKNGRYNGGPISPAVDALVELQQPPGQRKLLAMSPADYGDMLRARQPMPKVPELAEDGSERSYSSGIAFTRQESTHEYGMTPIDTPLGRAPSNPSIAPAQTNNGNAPAQTNTLNVSAQTNTVGTPAKTNNGNAPALSNTGNAPALSNTGNAPALGNTGNAPALSNTGNAPALSDPGSASPTVATQHQGTPAPRIGVTRDGKTSDLPMPPRFASHGPTSYDVASDTFSQRIGATTYHFDLADLEKRLAPGTGNLRDLAMHGKDIAMRNSPQGLVVFERTPHVALAMRAKEVESRGR